MLFPVISSAQGVVRGIVYDKQQSKPLGFVTVQVQSQASATFVGGAMTDAGGKFRIEGLKRGKYTLTLSYVGYKETTRDFEITADNSTKTFKIIYMTEDANQLSEVQVTGQKSAMKLEVDRKSFDVSQLISSAGQAATDLLDNIPSVEVDNDGNISLRGNTSVEVWING